MNLSDRIRKTPLEDTDPRRARTAGRIDVVSCGIGFPADAATLALLRDADATYGSRSLLAACPVPLKDARIIGAKAREDAAEALTLCRAGRRVVVLASGDALYHGFGGTLSGLCDAGDAILYHPGITAFQALFHRLGLPWSAARLFCAHSGGLPARAITEAPLSVTYAGTRYPADAIARALLDVHPASGRRAAVIAERLGSADERLLSGPLEDLARAACGPTSILVVFPERYAGNTPRKTAAGTPGGAPESAPEPAHEPAPTRSPAANPVGEPAARLPGAVIPAPLASAAAPDDRTTHPRNGGADDAQITRPPRTARTVQIAGITRTDRVSPDAAQPDAPAAAPDAPESRPEGRSDDVPEARKNRPADAPAAVPAPILALGLPEEDYERENNLITASDVRAVILSRLRLPAWGTLWDLGAGSGSVGLEAAALRPDLDVHGVERKPERGALIERNRLRMGVANYTLHLGDALDAVRGAPCLPDGNISDAAPGGEAPRAAAPVRAAVGEPMAAALSEKDGAAREPHPQDKERLRDVPPVPEGSLPTRDAVAAIRDVPPTPEGGPHRVPAGLSPASRLPDPDRVFLGGGGRELPELLTACLRRLRPGGLIVASAVTLESFAALLAWSPERRTGLCRLDVAVEQPIAGTNHHLKHRNTIHVFTFRKEATA